MKNKDFFTSYIGRFLWPYNRKELNELSVMPYLIVAITDSNDGFLGGWGPSFLILNFRSRSISPINANGACELINEGKWTLSEDNE